MVAPRKAKPNTDGPIGTNKKEPEQMFAVPVPSCCTCFGLRFAARVGLLLPFPGLPVQVSQHWPKWVSPMVRLLAFQVLRPTLAHRNQVPPLASPLADSPHSERQTFQERMQLERLDEVENDHIVLRLYRLTTLVARGKLLHCKQVLLFVTVSSHNRPLSNSLLCTSLYRNVGKRFKQDAQGLGPSLLPTTRYSLSQQLSFVVWLWECAPYTIIPQPLCRYGTCGRSRKPLTRSGTTCLVHRQELPNRAVK
jgi:hypothetical protein